MKLICIPMVQENSQQNKFDQIKILHLYTHLQYLSFIYSSCSAPITCLLLHSLSNLHHLCDNKAYEAINQSHHTGLTSTHLNA